MPSGLHGETKLGRWPVHLAGVERMRVTHTVETLFERWRPAEQDKAEFIHDSVLLANLARLLFAGRWEELHRTLGIPRASVPPAVPHPERARRG